MEYVALGYMATTVILALFLIRSIKRYKKLAGFTSLRLHDLEVTQNALDAARRKESG